MEKKNHCNYKFIKQLFNTFAKVNQLGYNGRAHTETNMFALKISYCNLAVPFRQMYLRYILKGNVPEREYAFDCSLIFLTKQKNVFLYLPAHISGKRLYPIEARDFHLLM